MIQHNLSLHASVGKIFQSMSITLETIVILIWLLLVVWFFRRIKGQIVRSSIEMLRTQRPLGNKGALWQVPAVDSGLMAGAGNPSGGRTKGNYFDYSGSFHIQERPFCFSNKMKTLQANFLTYSQRRGFFFCCCCWVVCFVFYKLCPLTSECKENLFEVIKLVVLGTNWWPYESALSMDKRHVLIVIKPWAWGRTRISI